MTADIENGAVGSSDPRPRPGTPDRTDRILVVAAVALWLTALGAGVAAVVALVDLANAHPVGAEKSDTPWLLYTVIGVSALVIIGAIPLLLKARQSAVASAPVRSPDDGARSGGAPSVAQAAVSPAAEQAESPGKSSPPAPEASLEKDGGGCAPPEPAAEKEEGGGSCGGGGASPEEKQEEPPDVSGAAVPQPGGALVLAAGAAGALGRRRQRVGKRET